MTKFFAASLIVLSFWIAANSDEPANHPVYPATRRVDQVDVLHGIPVADPYRWLETDVRESKDVNNWIEAQNALTAKRLHTHPARAAIKQSLQNLWNYERYSSPRKIGDRYAYFKNDGLQEHAVLYVIDNLDAEPRPLIDPNSWSKDGTIAVVGTSFSPDGRYLAYGVSEAGSDWQTWRIKDVESGQNLGDELKWLKFAHAAWTVDSQGFYYAAYDEPKPAARFQDVNLDHKVYYHRLGKAQTSDVTIYRCPDHPDWSFGLLVTDDGRYLILVVRKGDDDRQRILYLDLTQRDQKPVELIRRFENQFHFVSNDGPIFYFMTNRDAPNRRLIAIDTKKPEPQNWQEIIPQGAETIIDIGLVGNSFITVSLHDASTRVRVYSMNGEFRRDVKLPGIGTAHGFGGRREDRETFYSFSSFTTPPTVYRYEMASGVSSPLRTPRVDFATHDYHVEQAFVRSKDGSHMPVFLSYKKGLIRNGTNPTLLYGYGGYGFSLTPWYSVSALAWMEAGGLYVVPNLRGGGEYGENWHQAGVKLKKQNVFDDFIAVAEWLVENNYTSSGKLAIEGGSNGGLLVAAVMTQRPELFGACLPEVPQTDMLRFHRFTDGRFAVTELGSPDDPAEFRALLAYSPYHQIKKGTKYPATLITTGDTDDRVVPLHSFKFAAALQYAQADSAPVLLRVERQGGHGDQGKPTSKRIEEVTDQFVFLVENLGMRWGARPAK